VGQSVSRNKLVQAAKGDYVLFLDGDVVPIPGSISEMLDILVSNDQWTGVYYDVHGDIYDEAGATPVELPITMADMSTSPVPMFHYAVYDRGFLNAHPLPEFYPFDGPGWGVEEEMCGLTAPDILYGVINGRKFYHCQAGRSHNFLKTRLVESRAERYAVWQALRGLPLKDVEQVFQAKQPLMRKTRLKMATLATRDLVTDAGIQALGKFMPWMIWGEGCKDSGLTELLFEHDKRHHVLPKVAKGQARTALTVVPRRYSSVWLLANLPAVPTTPGGVPWLLLGGIRGLGKYRTLAGFRDGVAGYSGVMTDDVQTHWVTCLLGVPSEVSGVSGDDGDELSEDQCELLAELGLKRVMGMVEVGAFRVLIQNSCLSRVIVPLTAMLEGANGVA
jgi:hypothetical protein